VNIPLSKYRDLLAQYLKPHQALVGVLAVLLFGNIGVTLVGFENVEPRSRHRKFWRI